jgi:hypothetical protein
MAGAAAVPAGLWAAPIARPAAGGGRLRLGRRDED